MAGTKVTENLPIETTCGSDVNKQCTAASENGESIGNETHPPAVSSQQAKVFKPNHYSVKNKDFLRANDFYQRQQLSKSAARYQSALPNGQTGYHPRMRTGAMVQTTAMTLAGNPPRIQHCVAPPDIYDATMEQRSGWCNYATGQPPFWNNGGGGHPSGWHNGSEGHPPQWQNGSEGYPAGWHTGSEGYPPGWHNGLEGHPPGWQNGAAGQSHVRHNKTTRQQSSWHKGTARPPPVWRNGAPPRQTVQQNGMMVQSGWHNNVAGQFSLYNGYSGHPSGMQQTETVQLPNDYKPDIKAAGQLSDVRGNVTEHQPQLLGSVTEQLSNTTCIDKISGDLVNEKSKFSEGTICLMLQDVGIFNDIKQTEELLFEVKATEKDLLETMLGIAKNCETVHLFECNVRSALFLVTKLPLSEIANQQLDVIGNMVMSMHNEFLSKGEHLLRCLIAAKNDIDTDYEKFHSSITELQTISKNLISSPDLMAGTHTENATMRVRHVWTETAELKQQRIDKDERFLRFCPRIRSFLDNSHMVLADKGILKKSLLGLQY